MEVNKKQLADIFGASIRTIPELAGTGNARSASKRWQG